MKAIEFLDKHNICYQRFDHKAVFTCDEANEVIPDLGGARTKNLFLRNKKGKRHFLLVICEDKAIDLTELSKQLDSSRFSFGSAEQLDEYLGVEPGSVSLLSVLNDLEQKVELIVDADVWNATAVLCHPLVNTCTLVLAMEQMKTVMNLLGREVKVMEMPLK
ncbi:MAG: prolyl-tRNA synthetase associated domain-containing protein [Pseudomonadales bacterium]